MDPLIVVFGLGVGILIGMTGIGGGSLMTPLLILVIGTKPVVAIGTDLAYGALTKTVGGWRHLRKKTVDLGLSLWLAVGSVPGALVGVVAVERLHERHGESFDAPLLYAIGGVLLLVSVTVLFRALFLHHVIARERETVEFTGGQKVAAVVIGLVLGFVLGFTSVGSGALIGLALILVFNLTPHRVVGTDVFHAAILLWAAGLAHLVAGNVDLGLMANILVGSVPGVWIGTNLMTRVPSAGLRPALGCVLLGSALGVFSKAGLDLPAYVILGLPVIAGAVAWLVHRRRAGAAVHSTVPVSPIATDRV